MVSTKNKEKNHKETCPNCKSEEVSKNGTYTSINYFIKVFAMLLPFLGVSFIRHVQKYVCKECNTSFVSAEQKHNIYVKNVIKSTILRLIAVLRFGHGMSIRGIGDIIKNVYGICSSIGFIDKVCQQMADEAEKKMNILNQCNQKESKVLMYDETFPRAKDNGCVNLGVAVCENGLIRKVKKIDIAEKSKQTYGFFKSLINKNYKPSFFISDYDTTYPTEIKKVLPFIIILKDFVHTVRQIFRDSKSTINKTEVKVGKVKLTKEKQKQIKDLKKKLLRKQLNRILRKMIKGFKKRYCAVGTIYIEGSLEDLKDLSEKLPTLKPLHKKLSKFVNK